MNKKIIASIGMATILSTGLLFAETGGVAENKIMMTTHASSTVKTNKAAERATEDAAKIACVGTAVNIREASLGTGITTHTQAVVAAYGVRAVALKAAYTATTSKQLNTDVKAAWKTFDTSMKTAQSTWKASKNKAWETYKTAAVACKAPSGTGDSVHASNENGAF